MLIDLLRPPTASRIGFSIAEFLSLSLSLDGKMEQHSTRNLQRNIF
jgi:hypothetical protein